MKDNNNISSPPILKSIKVPFCAYYNDEYFDLNIIDDDQNFPFDPSTLLSSNLELNTNDLVQIAKEQSQHYVNMPQWRLDITQKEINLQFDYSNDLLNDCTLLPSESPGFITIETEKRKIEALSVTDDTKRMILEKFYKGRKHSDLKKLSSDRTVYSGVLYELFSKIYKQKPVITIDEVMGPDDDVKNKHQKKFIARHIFNNEILTTGYGTSKKVAKLEACKKSLEIFAPSLSTEVENHQKQLLGQEDEKIKKEETANLETKSTENIDDQVIKDPFIEALVSFYQEYYREVSLLQLKENIDGSLQDFNESPALLLFCQNQTFTKLHSIYELINCQRRPLSLINYIQIGSIFHVYLHCSEISLNFSHHSESLEMSCEMVKYQCIFALYNKECKSLSEILHCLKQDLEKKIRHCLEIHEPKKQLFLKQKSRNKKIPLKTKRNHNDLLIHDEAAIETLQKKIHGGSQSI